MKTATIEFESAELIAIMWAIEVATLKLGPGNLEDRDVTSAECRKFSFDLKGDAWAAHQRIQAAWLEICE